MDDTTTDSAAPGAGARYAKPLGVVAAVVVVAVAARQLGGYVPAVAAWVEGLGYWGPAVFILVYVAATVLFVPGSLLTLAGGAIFGVVQGTAIVWIAATLGSIAAFLVARYGARNWVAARLSERPRFAAIDRAVADNGLKITFLLRLSPIFPFSFMNYALGLTRVGLRDYALAATGMLPGTLLYVYYGHAIKEVAAIAVARPAGSDWGQYVVTGIGLIATVAVTTIVTRIARRALGEAADV